MSKKVKLGKYKHSKSGNSYEVIGVAKHSETLEDLVVYIPLYKNKTSMLWVRPIEMFTETIELSGKKVPRFKFQGK